MAQPIPPEQYDTIVALVAGFADAVALGELQRHLRPKPDAHELARCLVRLTRQGRIEVVAGTAGEPNARYRAVADLAQAAYQSAVDSSSTEPAKSGNQSCPADESPAVSRPKQPPDSAGADPISPPAHGTDETGLAASAGPTFDEVVREVIRDIVLSLVPRPSVIGVAQTQAMLLKWNPGQTAALLARVDDELRRVTPENAAAYGVVPEQVRAWRKAYDAGIAAPVSGPSHEPAVPAAKPQGETALPPSTAAAPPKNVSRSNSRPKPEQSSVRTRSADESAGEVEIATSGDLTWVPSGAAKEPIFALVAKMLGTTWAGALGRGLGDKLTVKERIAFGSAIAATLGSIFQPFVNSGWAKIGVPLIAAVAFVGYTVRTRGTASSGNGVVTPPGLMVREFITRYRWRLGAGCVLALSAFAGWIWYQRVVLRPPKAAIGEYLVSSVAPAPVRLVGVDVTYGSPTETGCPVTYQALFQSTEPLYQRVDATAYLRQHAATELAAIDAADAILRGPDGARILAAVETNAPAGWAIDRSASLLLVRSQTAPGAIATAAGTLLAWRQDGQWRFAGSTVTLDRHALVGDPKPAGALVIDLVADVARLTAMIAEQVGYATKVEAAAEALAAADERNRQEKAVSFAALLEPGTLFTGTIVDPIRGSNQRVIVELTAAANQQVSAALRNDGGWTDSRAFTGNWTLGSTGDIAIVTLRTARNDYVEAAGPLLEDRNDYSITLQVHADGTVTSIPGNRRLQRVDPANADAVKAEVLRPLGSAIDATAAGLVYRGTAKSRISRTTESLFLRFTEQNGSEFQASLESATIPGQMRALRGAVISNTYRVGNAPIRLQSDDAARVVAAGPRSPLGLDTANNSLVIGLRADGSRLSGQDNWFTYEFTPAEPGATASAPTSATGAPEVSDGGGAVFTVPAYDPRNTLPLPHTPIPLPPFPTTTGAYMLNAHHWMILPRNTGRVIEVSRNVNGGVGELIFYGDERVPAAQPGEVTLIYVGRPPPLGTATLKKFPHLKVESQFEITPLLLGSGIVRHAVVTELSPEYIGFGARKVPLTSDRVADDITLLRCRLQAGRYALACGPQLL